MGWGYTLLLYPTSKQRPAWKGRGGRGLPLSSLLVTRLPTAVAAQRDRELNSRRSAHLRTWWVGRRALLVFRGVDRLLGLGFGHDGDHEPFIGNIERVEAQHFAGALDLRLNRNQVRLEFNQAGGIGREYDQRRGQSASSAVTHGSGGDPCIQQGGHQAVKRCTVALYS